MNEPEILPPGSDAGQREPTLKGHEAWREIGRAGCRRRCCRSGRGRPWWRTAAEGGAVVVDEEPVAEVAAVAVDGEGAGRGGR